MTKKIGDKSCQSNFDTRASDFGSFLFSYLITTVTESILTWESKQGKKAKMTFLKVTRVSKK